MKKLFNYNGLFAWITIFAASLILSSCNKSDDGPGSDPTTQTGRISGVVTTPSGTPVGAATVKSGNYTARTNRNGQFEIMVPAGNNHLVIYTGSGNVFKTELDVNVAADASLVLPQSETVLKQIKQIAFFAGQYDNIQTIIIDSLGYTAVPGQIYNLANPSYHQNFGGLFFNCGVLSSVFLNSAIYAGLSDYVNNHGSIYVSDYAVELITGDGNLRIMNPENTSGKKHDHQSSSGSPFVQGICSTPQLGGFLPDSSLCTSKSGPQTMIPVADVLDPDLILALGKDSMNIIYDLPNWERVSLIDAPFTTLIEDNTFNFGPLAASCDLNGSNPGGKIFFTTFHNHPQTLISQDMKLILQYFILNL